MSRTEEILLKEMRYIASISNGQVKRVADQALESAKEYLATEPKPTLKEALTQQGIKLRTEFEPKKWDSDRSHLRFGGCPACGKRSCIARSCTTPEPSGDRAELIARLNECLSGPAALTTREATAIKDAADMLEADAQQAKPTDWSAA